MTTPDDDGQGLSPAETLALIARQQERMRHALRPNPVAVSAAWGVAWLVGFGLCYLASVRTGVPTWVPVVVTVALFAAAIAVPVIQSARAGKGVVGPSKQVAAMYGAAWGLAFGALTAVNGALSDQAHLSEHAATLLWSGTSLLVVGLLYLTGGALWHEPVQYALGVWMLIVGAGSVFAGVPGNFLVLALAGGGGFLAMAGYYWLRRGGRDV
jgi:hypothetical protein